MAKTEPLGLLLHAPSRASERPVTAPETAVKLVLARKPAEPAPVPSLVLPRAVEGPVVPEDAEPIDYLVPEPDEEDSDLPDALPDAASGGLKPGGIRAAMRDAEATLAELVATPPFAAALAELYALPRGDRAAFVREELLDDFGRLPRGIRLPDRVAVRPARAGGAELFSLVCRLPDELHVPWQNAVLTFRHDRTPG